MEFNGAETGCIAAEKAEIHSKFTIYITQMPFPDYNGM